MNAIAIDKNKTDATDLRPSSEQSKANRKHYLAIATQAQSGKTISPEEATKRNDEQWAMLTAEPTGVSYEHVDAGGIAAMWIDPKGSVCDRVILYAHGGGFVGGSIASHRKMVGHLAKATGCRALLFEYSYAYQKKYPAQLDTAVVVYRWLIEQSIKPQHIALAGDSAGAILAIGILQQSRRLGLPMPAAVMIISGWFDMSLSGASYEANRSVDPFFKKETVQWLVQNILGQIGDPRDPLASPLFADMNGLPPIYLQAGADETLVDDSRMFAARAEGAGAEVRLEVFPQMLHSFQMMAGNAPESDDAINRLAAWVRPHLALTSADQRAEIPHA